MLFLPPVVSLSSLIAGCLGLAALCSVLIKCLKHLLGLGPSGGCAMGIVSSDHKSHTVTRGGVSRVLMYLIQLGV